MAIVTSKVSTECGTSSNGRAQGLLTGDVVWVGVAVVGLAVGVVGEVVGLAVAEVEVGLAVGDSLLCVGSTVGSLVGSWRVCVGNGCGAGAFSLLTSPHRVPTARPPMTTRARMPQTQPPKDAFDSRSGTSSGVGGTGSDPPPDMALRLGRTG